MTDKIVVMCTCASREEAEAIARGVVEKRLAACVNLLPAVRSIYHWQGAIEEGDEILIVAKTKRLLFDELKRAIQASHSYLVPEIIALPIVDGAESYLDWIDLETGQTPTA